MGEREVKCQWCDIRIKFHSWKRRSPVAIGANSALEMSRKTEKSLQLSGTAASKKKKFPETLTYIQLRYNMCQRTHSNVGS